MFFYQVISDLCIKSLDSKRLGNIVKRVKHTKLPGVIIKLTTFSLFLQLRAEAEGRAREEQLLREAEQERLRELEAIKKELERLLAEERQAKKDEETVRALQARLAETLTP